MSLIHELEALQAERGHLDPESLRELAARIGEPLYRLQEIISFYPHFRVDPPCTRRGARVPGHELPPRRR